MSTYWIVYSSSAHMTDGRSCRLSKAIDAPSHGSLAVREVVVLVTQHRVMS